VSYDFTHCCFYGISFFFWSAVSIYVSELQSPSDLHLLLVKLYDCSFSVKTTHEIHFGAIVIVLVHDVWNLPVCPCGCGGEGEVRVWHLPRYVVVSGSIFLTWDFYHIHNVGHDEGNIKVRSWGILVIVGVMINSTIGLVPGGSGCARSDLFQVDKLAHITCQRV